MLQENASMPVSENAELNAKTEWSPYTPKQWDVIERTIKVATPDLDELEVWMNEKVFGYCGMWVDRYVEMDADLLRDKLNDVLVNEDEFRLLNWIFRIVRLMEPSNDNIIFQMPEDYYRVFCPKDYKDICRVSESILLRSNIEIDSIHDQFLSGYTNQSDSEEKVKVRKTMQVYSLKAIAIWALMWLKAKKDGKFDGEAIEFTFTELGAAWPEIRTKFFGWFNLNWENPAEDDPGLQRAMRSDTLYLGDGRAVQQYPTTLSFASARKQFKSFLGEKHD